MLVGPFDAHRDEFLVSGSRWTAGWVESRTSYGQRVESARREADRTVWSDDRGGFLILLLWHVLRWVVSIKLEQSAQHGQLLGMVDEHESDLVSTEEWGHRMLRSRCAFVFSFHIVRTQTVLWRPKMPFPG